MDDLRFLAAVAVALASLGVLLWRASARAERIEARLDEHGRRLDKGDTRFASIDAKLDKLIEDVHAIRVDLAGRADRPP